MMTLSLVMHDWRLLERVVGLTNRLGCAYTRVDVRAGDEHYHATIDFVGAPMRCAGSTPSSRDS